MTALAPYISSFLREHLPKERRASLHTCEAYAHSFRLLVGFAASRLDVRPCRLEIEQLDVPLILRHRGKPRKLGHAMLGSPLSMPSSASWSTACRRVSIRRVESMRSR